MVAKTSPVPRAPRLPSLSKYEVMEELGHGGMATVYRAHDPRLGRDVAVKLLHAHLRDSTEVVARFSTEARAVAMLRHPNIVEVYDVSGEDEAEQFLVVELVRGPSLRKVLAARGALPPEVGAAIVVDVLAALASAHEAGVVHRDVKPENVLVEHREAPPGDVGRDGSGELSRVRVKLTDFGIAKLLDAQGVTSTGQVLGSPAHMAPEQIDGTDVDERADVFGAGVLFYECIVGHLPFEGQNPAQVLRRVLEGVYAPADAERPEVGSVFSRICDRALARDPADRFPSARAMRDAICDELRRLDVAEAHAELEAYFDDPEGYEERHEERLVARLRVLGDEARARGDVLSAAADYNRALAFTPHDAKLIRLVTGMRRTDARRALARKLLPLLLVATVVGGASYSLAHALRPRPPALATIGSSRVVPPKPVDSSALALATASASAAASQRPSVPARPTVAARPSAAPRVRVLGFASVVPAQGVLVAIDGAPAGEVSVDRQVSIDDQAHELTFTCAANLCAPERRLVAAGDAPVRLEIALRIRDAQLFVEGRADHSYGIDKRPNMTFRAGSKVNVAMPTGGPAYEDVYVVELETQRKMRVQLKGGTLARVVFPAE